MNPSLCECGHAIEAHNARCSGTVPGVGAASDFLYPCACRKFNPANASEPAALAAFVADMLTEFADRGLITRDERSSWLGRWNDALDEARSE